MTRGFAEVLDDFLAVARNPHSAARRVYDAAMRLPQTESGGESVRMADGIVRAQFAAHTWAQSVESAAAGLRLQVEAYDADSAEYSERKMRNYAAALLTAIGEGE